MVTIVKHEWHQHDRQYAIKLDEALLSEIYPDLDEDEIVQKLTDIQLGEVDFEEVINDAYENDVEMEWEFQYDDCWTDRKGGYDVTYELGDESSWHNVEEPIDEADLEADLEELKREFEKLPVVDKISAHWPTPDSDFVETAKWPFGDDTEDEGSLKESYPEDTYTIRIWGRTREIGVHKIKKQQYEHWSSEEHEDDLSDALNENYDYDENGTPKAARFDLPYYEYQGKHSFWGFDQDDTHMTIENSEGETIYEGDLESFFSDAHGEEDSRWETSEEQEELYPEHLGKGYWLMWTQGGKGSCIQTTIEGVFEPKKLKVLNWDIQGTSVVTRLVYDGDELDDNGMDSEHDNWRGQWAQFDVYHNTK